MTKKENKFDSFPSCDLKDWERVAKAELQGADPWEKLTVHENGLLIKPFYSQNDRTNNFFRLSASKSTFLGPRAWYNCPLVKVDDALKANDTALQHLRQGADGIFFELAEPVSFKTLLQTIDWKFCALNFLAKENGEAHARDLSMFLKKQLEASGNAVGAFFGDADVLHPGRTGFSFAGHRIVASGAPIAVLADGVRSLEQRLQDAFIERSAEAAFSVEIGTDFFVEIAKLRALRIVWDKLLTARKAKPGTPVFIHAFCGRWDEKTYSPHENMLKGTSSAMAAILGGCDALTIEAADQEDASLNSVARNISNILREESHFSLVSDPLCGSYFIEELTQQIAEGAWKILLAERKS